jgi:DNA repair exonuclease SbcCD nuclease subunit
MSFYLLVNDIHMGPAPSSCTDTYSDDLLDLLRQTVRATHERSYAGVVWAGDVFHHKAPSRTSHAMVQQMIEIVQGYNCPVWVVPGNHDMQHDRQDSILLTQPLGVLVRAGLKILDGWPDNGNRQLFGVPWQQHWSTDFIHDALSSYLSRVDVQPTLVVTHAPIYPPGLELKFEYTLASDWADGMGNKGYVWYGHVHESHGKPYKVDGVTFANFGALSRGSLHEHNLTRKITVGVWDSVTGAFHMSPLEAKPADQVFRLAEKKQVTDMQGRLDAFLQQAGSAQLEVLSVETVLDHIRSLNLGPDAVTLAEELLAKAATEARK